MLETLIRRFIRFVKQLFRSRFLKQEQINEPLTPKPSDNPVETRIIEKKQLDAEIYREIEHDLMRDYKQHYGVSGTLNNTTGVSGVPGWKDKPWGNKPIKKSGGRKRR